MVGFQPLGRLEYQLDWIDGGLEFTDKGLVFGPPVRFGLDVPAGSNLMQEVLLLM